MVRNLAAVYGGLIFLVPPIYRPLALVRIPLESAISERFKVLDEIGARARIS
jgi:hypothetical protein